MQIIKIGFSIFFILFVSVFAFFAIDKYAGETNVYVFFTLISSVLLLYGFRQNSIFFDTFIGVFLWLGFWLKITVSVIFFNSEFREGLIGLKITGDVFDEALLVSSIAFISLILASFIREKYFFIYSQAKDEINGLFIFYKKYRKYILSAYIILFVFIGFSNFYFGIYQRGEISQTILPFGLNGIYKWLLLFGLSSFAALILKYEFSLKEKTVYFVPILTLIEAFVTNVSLFSRGMILNSSALGYGMLSYLKNKMIKINIKFLFILVSIFIFLFISSISVVDNLRKNSKYNTDANVLTNISSQQILNTPFSLLIKRWVGAEGIIAVANNDSKSWFLFEKAMAEKPGDYSTSFYDENIIESPYKDWDMSKHHYMSLPGFIAFFYYTGSVLFVFIMVFLLALLASFIEILAYKLGGKNLILAALIAQVIAYRYTHFGYTPIKSYLLFGSIFLNLFIIYMANKILSVRYKKEIEDAKS